MSEIKPVTRFDLGYSFYGYAEMQTSETGDYVEFAALEALQAENEELKRKHKFTCENLDNTVPFIEELEQKNAAAPEYNESVICKKCNGNMKQGTAIQNSIVSATPDFPDQLHGVTMSMDGEAAMVSCMKCEKCGNSFSIKDNK